MINDYVTAIGIITNAIVGGQMSRLMNFCFRAFGEIKTLRLPKKLTPGSEQHRGFAFVDYHSKTDAKVICR